MIDNVAAEDRELDRFYNTFEKMRDPSHCRALQISEWKTLLNKHKLSLINDLSRKKKLPFPEWARRTTDEKGVRAVQDYFLKASESHREHFNIQRDGDQITEFTIDEWMVLCQK
ncbi:hypothetical protein [Halobacillus campisalis]|uniref:Uncharacterized protein n=1 Tax=Halobacillus campisalis TaxID=435909 RepID=A0ABW2K6H3_9BACI